MSDYEGIKQLQKDGIRVFVKVEEEFVLEQARASEKRLKDGKPLSIFDGVVVAVKDELHLKVRAYLTLILTIIGFPYSSWN